MFLHVQDEVGKSIFCATYRTREDIMKPFDNEHSPVTQSGLVLLSVDNVILQSPSYDHLTLSARLATSLTSTYIESATLT